MLQHVVLSSNLYQGPVSQTHGNLIPYSLLPLSRVRLGTRLHKSIFQGLGADSQSNLRPPMPRIGTRTHHTHGEIALQIR